MIKLKRLVEGGWISQKTQDTIITPSIVEESLTYLHKFLKDFNAWVNKKYSLPPLEFVRPVGSVTYYEKDKVSDPEKEYGDIDTLIKFPVLADKFSELSELDAEKESEKLYEEKIKEFLTTTKPSYIDSDTLKGARTNLIFNIGNNRYTQVDLVFAADKYSKWTAGRFTPEHGLKGFTLGSLHTALGYTFNLSLDRRGVLSKFKDGILVPYKLRKGTETKHVSHDYKNFLFDLAKFLASYLQPDVQSIKIDPLLSKYKGLDPDNPSLKNYCLGIVGLARTLENNGLLKSDKITFDDAQDIIEDVRKNYEETIKKTLASTKFEKAASEKSFQSIEKYKQHAAKALAIVNQYLRA